MIEFTTYKSTGEIISSGICQDDMLEAQANPAKGILVMEGKYDYKTQFVSDGVVVDKPDKPSGAYTFDYNTKQWVQDLSTQKLTVRIERDSRLLQSDWTDTVSAQTRLGTEVYIAWQTYRQALRDITSQQGYPYDVTWPTPPEG